MIKTISILGSGWLGLPLARRLIAANHSIKASTRSKARMTSLAALEFEPFIIDIDTTTPIDPAFLQSDLLIINIPSKNMAGFKRLIQLIVASPIKHVLFISSTSVYDNTNDVVTENDCDPASDKPLIIIEQLFINCPSIQTTIIRFAGLIGDGRHPGRFFRPREDQQKRVIPHPNAPVNLIHQDDCIEIIHQIIDQGVWGEVFNACADTHPDKKTFYSHAARACGLAAPDFEGIDTSNSSTKPSFKIIDNTKIKKALGYRFIHPDLMQIKFKP